MNEPPDQPRRDQPPAQPAPSPAPTATAPTAVEDAGAQALAEALRSSFAIIRLVMVALVIVFLGSGVFTVGSQERAIILRLGKVVGQGEAALLGPGFHWAWPYPIDEVDKIPIGQIQSVRSSVGWYAVEPGADPLTNAPISTLSLNPATDGYTLSAEGNIMHVWATLRYRITDPVKYHFGFTNAATVVTNILDNAILFASARYKVDDAYRLDRNGFTEKVLARVDQLIAQQDLGVTREQSEVIARPPYALKEVFDQVGTAEQSSSTTNNAARSEADKIVSEARSTAATRVSAAENERIRFVDLIDSEAKTFLALLPRYEENPRLFLEQRQMEALLRALTNSQDKILVVDRADGKPRQLRIQLNREPEERPKKTP
jgi:membrane protease subunit HflK